MISRPHIFPTVARPKVVDCNYSFCVVLDEEQDDKEMGDAQIAFMPGIMNGGG